VFPVFAMKKNRTVFAANDVLARDSSPYNQDMHQFPTIRLAIPSRTPAAFDSPDWVFGMKHDGFRALAYIADGRCQLVSVMSSTE
jgi:hypothetical protein